MVQSRPTFAYLSSQVSQVFFTVLGSGRENVLIKTETEGYKIQIKLSLIPRLA